MKKKAISLLLVGAMVAAMVAVSIRVVGILVISSLIALPVAAGPPLGQGV